MEPHYPTHPRVPRNQSLRRAVDLLSLLGGNEQGLTVSELATLSDSPRATVTRTLATFGDVGFVRRDASDRWTLGHGLAQLARKATPYGHVLSAAAGLLEEITSLSGESAVLGVREPDGSIDVISQVDGPGLVGVTNWIGRPFDLHTSAFGKLLLSEMPDDAVRRLLKNETRGSTDVDTLASRLLDELRVVRERGYAETVDEIEVGVSGIAVAVRDSSGRSVAYLGALGPTFRFDSPSMRSCLDLLTRAAGKLHKRLAL